MTDIFTSIDLEMDQPGNEIIEVGACVGNLRTGEILEEGRWYVKLDHPLNPMIVQLTGITDQLLAEKGVTLQEAYAGLTELHKKHGSHRNPLVWGQGDSPLLRKQLGISDLEAYLFGRREFDVKTLFQFWRFSQGEKLQSGLAKSLTKLGLAFDGRKHVARDDARNTFRGAHALLRKMRK